MKPSKTQLKHGLAYVVSGFPRISETFILNEILEMERQGISLVVFSLKRSTDFYVQQEFYELKSLVYYVPQRLSVHLLFSAMWAGFYWLLSSRKRFISIAREFIESSKKERHFSLGLSFLRWLWLSRQLRLHKIKTVHAHFAHDPATMVYWVSRLTGVPYSFTAHAKDIYCYSIEWLKMKLHAARFVVTCNLNNKKFLESISLNGTPIHCAYHGVNVMKFSHGVQEKSTPPLVLSVGRLIEKKGFKTLIQACAHLLSQGITFQCQIVGHGPLRADLNKMIDDLGLREQVRLVGTKLHVELLQLYAKASVFVLPCQITADGDQDGLPNVIMEAMAMQLPVISTRVAAVPEAVKHEETGLLIQPGNANQLFLATQRLLANPALAAKMGKAGRKKVLDKFEIKKNVSLLKELLV